MDKLINGWAISPSWGEYILIAMVLQVIVRIIISMLKAWELAHVGREFFWVLFRRNLIGVHPNDNGDQSDYLQPCILGTLELLSYPVLMATGAWSVIGAWIGYKALAQFNRWKENRSTFSRFLIGNALVVISSLWFLAPHVTVK